MFVAAMFAVAMFYIYIAHSMLLRCLRIYRASRKKHIAMARYTCKHRNNKLFLHAKTVITKFVSATSGISCDVSNTMMYSVIYHINCIGT